MSEPQEWAKPSDRAAIERDKQKLVQEELKKSKEQDKREDTHDSENKGHLTGGTDEVNEGPG